MGSSLEAVRKEDERQPFLREEVKPAQARRLYQPSAESPLQVTVDVRIILRPEESGSPAPRKIHLDSPAGEIARPLFLQRGPFEERLKNLASLLQGKGRGNVLPFRALGHAFNLAPSHSASEFVLEIRNRLGNRKAQGLHRQIDHRASDIRADIAFEPIHGWIEVERRMAVRMMRKTARHLPSDLQADPPGHLQNRNLPFHCLQDHLSSRELTINSPVSFALTRFKNRSL